MQNPEDNPLNADKAITELLANNKQLLDKQITRDTIENFVSLFTIQKKSD
jgi:hypothetical protein